MMNVRRTSRRFAFLAVAALALSAAACKDDHDHDDVDVDFMRLTIGAQEILVNAAGAATGTPVNLVQGSAVTVSAQFLKSDMTDALGSAADEFQLSVAPDAGITFTRTGPFSGTLTGTSTGSLLLVRFGLFHIDEGHDDFGPFPIGFIVNAPAAAAR